MLFTLNCYLSIFAMHELSNGRITVSSMHYLYTQQFARFICAHNYFANGIMNTAKQCNKSERVE